MRKGIYILFICIFSFSFVSCNGKGKENAKEMASIEKEEALKAEEEKKEEEKLIEKKKEEAKLLEEKKKEELLEEKRRREIKLENDKIKDMEKKRKTIVIDPGHSSKGTGAKEKVSPNSSKVKLKDTSGGVSRNKKIPEYVVTHRIGNKLKIALEKAGYNVIMTKESKDISMSNIERAEVGNNNNADLMIRLHLDSAESEQARGGSMLVPAEVGYMTRSNKEKSRKYGETIFNSYIGETGLKSRGIIIRDDLTGFNWSKVPVVLLEMGFFSNSKEEEFFLNEENDNKIIRGIVQGINKIDFSK